MSMSYATFSLLLSVMFGQLGLLLLFPTLRFVRSQIGAERAPQSTLTYALLYCNLILPFVACASWMHLPLPAFMQKQVDEHGESSALFDLRVGLLYLVGVIRVITFRTHIQNFFDMAPDRIMKLRNMPLNLKRWQRRRTWAADVKVPAHKVCGMVTQISDFLSGHCTFVMLPVVFFMSFVILLRTRSVLNYLAACFARWLGSVPRVFVMPPVLSVWIRALLRVARAKGDTRPRHARLQRKCYAVWRPNNLPASALGLA